MKQAGREEGKETGKGRSQKGTQTSRYRCPCCGYFTLDEGGGRHEICPVCFWEDDAAQERDADYEGGANRVSLKQAKENFAKYGACEERFAALVREPQEGEFGYAGDM